MSATAEHFTSIDRQLADARAAWEAEKRELLDHIKVLETELVIRTRLHDDAILAKDNANKMAATLVAQFAIVESVFADAKELALSAGLNSRHPPTEKVAAAQAKALAAIDEAIGGAPDVV